MTDSDHRVVLVTGAARRVGASIARTLHAAGFNLALHCRRSRTELEGLLATFEAARPQSTLLLQADLAELSGLQGLVDATVARFGRLDGLVNNASQFNATPFGRISSGQWHELFAANARAPLFLAQAAAPHLRVTRGAIVNITDIFAERPLREHLVYSMSKAALRMATLALAQELGPEVRVNAVAPGNVLASENAVKAETEADVIQRTSLRRRGTPDEVAAAVLWLLRDASYVSGQTLRVDGGRILGA